LFEGKYVRKAAGELDIAVERQMDSSMDGEINTAFCFKSDTPWGKKRGAIRKKDPDAFSPTLRRYHKLLWSKPLPDGFPFKLVDTIPKSYLYHKSEKGEFWLSSDTVIPTFTREKKIRHVIEQIPPYDLDWFHAIGYTIGGMMVFPGQRMGGKMTINGARGFHPQIKDRFDLTVECIRLYYLREWSPLRDVLERYADFFDLFNDFSGYVKHFLLQDIVNDECSEVKFFMPFDSFKTSPLPPSKDAYVLYMQHALEFIEARNKRIREYCKA